MTPVEHCMEAEQSLCGNEWQLSIADQEFIPYLTSLIHPPKIEHYSESFLAEATDVIAP